MSRPSRAAFGRLARRLDDGALAAFVADLWAARGRETEVRDGVVAATDPGTGERRVLLPLGHRPWPSRLRGRDRPAAAPPDRDVDVVVTVGRGSRARALAAASGADLVDESGLYDIVTYAIAGERRRRLFERHFGRHPDPDGGAVRSLHPSDVAWYASRAYGALGSLPLDRRWAALLLAAVVVVAGVAAVPNPPTGTGDTPVGEPTLDGFPGGGQPAANATVRPAGGSGRTATPRTDEPPPPAGDGAPGWPMFGFDPGRTGYAPRAVGPRGAAVEATNRSLTYPVVGAPVRTGGTVYVGRYDGTVFALDASSLSVEWRSSLGGKITSSPAAAEGTVYVATAGNGGSNGSRGPAAAGLHALSAADGTVRWSVPVGPAVRSSPAFANGTLYVGDERGRVYAVDAAAGVELWNVSVGGRVRSSPAFANGTLYVAGAGGSVHALHAGTGRQRWNRSVGGRITATPAVANGTAYVGTRAGRVYAFDAATGRERWRRSTRGGVRVSPAVADGTVFALDDPGWVYAFDAATGRERWNRSLDGSGSAPPAAANRTLYVGTRYGNVYSGASEGRLYALDAATGGVRWTFTANGPISASPMVGGGAVHVGDVYGWVYRIAGCDPAADATRCR